MKKIKYRLKQGYGSHRVGGKTYVAGEVIVTNEEELSGALDKFEPLEDPPPLPQPVAGLYSEQCEGGYNVINSATGKKINDEPLDQKTAESMAMKSLDDAIAELEETEKATAEEDNEPDAEAQR